MTLAAALAAHWSLRFDAAIVGHGEVRHQLYGGDASGARTLLVTVAGSMITVAGVVFSITIVTLSLASQQFGPRLLRNFMRDLGNQIVLGVFIASFVYCMMIIRAIPGDEATIVPSFSVAAGLLMGLLGLGFLIYFIHHVSDSIQVDTVLATIADEAEHSVALLYPHHPAATWRRSIDARRARRHRRRVMAAAAPRADGAAAELAQNLQEGVVPVFSRLLAIRPEDLTVLEGHAALYHSAFRGEPPHDMELIEESWCRFDAIRRERTGRMANAPA